MTDRRTALDCFFSPRSIAVVGASRSPRKLGYVLADNILRARFEGDVYAVNLTGERVLGLPSHRRLQEIAGAVDLAVVVVPAAAVLEVIEDCGAKRVPAAVIITAGFRETGPAGAALEQQVLARARDGGVRIIGPNSVGIVNTFARLNATFADTVPAPHEVALVSQSGAVATAILDWARAVGGGFSKFVSLGNMADVSEVELLEYLAHDAESRAIVGYFEGFSDGRSFYEAARTVTPRKPLVVMKVGRSAAGARAAVSHTGAMATSDAVVDAAFRQAGILRAYTMDELFDYTLAFSYVRPPGGRRLAIVTNAGGPGVMAADAAERWGMQLARLSDETVTALEASLPPAAATQNPIDVLGDAPPDRYERAVELALGDANVDGLIVLLTPQAVTQPEQTSRVITHLARVHEKPLLAVYMGGDAVARGRLMLDASHVPAYHYPERAVRAMAALYRYGCFLRETDDGRDSTATVARQAATGPSR